jgi:hypothetical protein
LGRGASRCACWTEKSIPVLLLSVVVVRHANRNDDPSTRHTFCKKRWTVCASAIWVDPKIMTMTMTTIIPPPTPTQPPPQRVQVDSAGETSTTTTRQRQHTVRAQLATIEKSQLPNEHHNFVVATNSLTQPGHQPASTAGCGWLPCYCIWRSSRTFVLLYGQGDSTLHFLRSWEMVSKIDTLYATSSAKINNNIKL